MAGLASLSTSGEEIPCPVYRFPGISQSRTVPSSVCIFGQRRFQRLQMPDPGVAMQSTTGAAAVHHLGNARQQGEAVV